MPRVADPDPGFEMRSDPDPRFEMRSDPVSKFGQIRIRVFFEGRNRIRGFLSKVESRAIFSRRSDPDPGKIRTPVFVYRLCLGSRFGGPVIFSANNIRHMLPNHNCQNTTNTKAIKILMIKKLIMIKKINNDKKINNADNI